MKVHVNEAWHEEKAPEPGHADHQAGEVVGKVKTGAVKLKTIVVRAAAVRPNADEKTSEDDVASESDVAARVREEQEQAFFNLLARGLSRELLRLLCMSIAMAIIETHSPFMLATVVLSSTLVFLLNVCDSIENLPLAITATAACALVTVAVLMGFWSLVRQIEANDKVTAKFDAAAADLGLDNAEYLGPPTRIDAELRQPGELGAVAVESLIAQANELREGFEENVVKTIAARGSDTPGILLEWLAGVKGAARAQEKTALEYNGDARCLKDLLRASVITNTLTELLACVAVVYELEAAGVIRVKQIKNRFHDGRSGYRDMNWSIVYREHVCELQLHLRRIIEIKEEAHQSYEVCRKLGLTGDHPEDTEDTDVKLPLLLQVAIFVTRGIGIYVAFALVQGYIVFGEIGGRINLRIGGESTRFPWWLWLMCCVPPFLMLEYLLFASMFQRAWRSITAIILLWCVFVASVVIAMALNEGMVATAFSTLVTLVAVPVAAILLSLRACGRAGASRPSRVGLLYRRYFGITGIFFEPKALASQGVSVSLQVAFRLPSIAAAAPLSGKRGTNPINDMMGTGLVGIFLPTGTWPYWIFVGVLVLNATVPSLLLSAESARIRREVMSAFDIGCDMTYVIVSLWFGVSLVMPDLIPTDIGGFVTSLYPLVRVLAATRALERAVGARLKAQQRAAEYARTHRVVSHAFTSQVSKSGRSRLETHTLLLIHGPGRHDGPLLRTAKVCVSLVLLGVILGVSFADGNFGLRRALPADCGPCDLSKGTLANCDHGAERTLRELRVKWLFFIHKKIKAIEPGAFDGLGNELENVWLDFNSITTIRNGTFLGLGSINYLSLQYNHVSNIEFGAFDGVDQLKELVMYGNPLTCAEMADQLPHGARCSDSRQQYLPACTEACWEL